jgi:hypothetical protein
MVAFWKRCSCRRSSCGDGVEEINCSSKGSYFYPLSGYLADGRTTGLLTRQGGQKNEGMNNESPAQTRPKKPDQTSPKQLALPYSSLEERPNLLRLGNLMHQASVTGGAPFSTSSTP